MSSTSPCKGEDIEESGIWMSQHERFVFQSKKTEHDVLLLGDSVLQNFQFSPVYKNLIEPLHVLNFCIHDDQTQNILWRVMNGELDGFSPKVIILMVGTHNKTHSHKEIAEGINQIVKVIKEKQPNSHIILIGLLPCGRLPNPKRTKHDLVNKELAELFKSTKNLTFINPDAEKFLHADGSISHRDMLDYLNPTENGYSKLADIISDELQSCLKNFLKTNAPSSGLGNTSN